MGGVCVCVESLPRSTGSHLMMTTEGAEVAFVMDGSQDAEFMTWREIGINNTRPYGPSNNSFSPPPVINSLKR